MKEETAFRGLERALACLEKGLEGKEWLVGREGVSLGDLSVASALVPGFLLVIDEEVRGRFLGVVRWYERVVGWRGLGRLWGRRLLLRSGRVPQFRVMDIPYVQLLRYSFFSFSESCIATLGPCSSQTNGLYPSLFFALSMQKCLVMQLSQAFVLVSGGSPSLNTQNFRSSI